MNIHYLLLLVIMAITFFIYSLNESQNNKKICITIVTVIMTLFTGLRSWWFGDLIKYYTGYVGCTGENWKEVVFEKFTNIGLRLLYRIVSFLGGNFEVVLFLIALLVAVSLGIVIYKYSPSPYWSYLIYISLGFYIFTYSGLKQTVAMSFLMFAAIGLFESNLKKFLFWVFIAGTFHAPAFIFLPAYAFAGLKIDRHYFILIGFIALTVFLFQDQILSMLADAYYDSEAEYVANKTIGGRTLMMWFIIGIAWFLRPPREGDTIYCKVFNLMILAAIIQYFSIYGNVFTRLADYYYQFSILFFPLMLESAEHRLKNDPNPKYTIRVHQEYIYTFFAIGITLFALWFYSPQVNNALIQGYKFFWEVDAYALYGGGVE